MESKSYIKYVTLFNERQYSKKWIECDEFVEKICYNLRIGLLPFLPENALDEVVAMIKKYPICVQIETPRKKRRGAYQKAVDKTNHIIYINNNLDNEEFLDVFLHEYAHLIQELTFLRSPWHDWEFAFCLKKLKDCFVKKNIIAENRVHMNTEFLFLLEKIRFGVTFKYKGNVYKKVLFNDKKIHCKLLSSDNTILELEPDTLVEPVLDLQW